MRFINWLKPAFQDNDGTASYRRIMAFMFAVVDLGLVIAGRIDTQIMLDVHDSMLLFIGALAGIIAGQNIIQTKRTKTDEK